MSEVQKRFFDLVNYYEELQTKVKEIKAELESMLHDFGEDTYIQDKNTDIVYKIVKPKGRFVYYSDLDYVRTAKVGERAGTLSKKEAEENGFIFTKKG